MAGGAGRGGACDSYEWVHAKTDRRGSEGERVKLDFYQHAPRKQVHCYNESFHGHKVVFFCDGKGRLKLLTLNLIN